MAVSLTLQRLAWMLMEWPCDWWSDQCAGVRGLPAVTLASPLAGCVTLRGPFAGLQALLIHLARWPLCESLPHFQGAVTCFDFFYFLIYLGASVFAAARGIFAAARGVSSRRSWA